MRSYLVSVVVLVGLLNFGGCPASPVGNGGQPGGSDSAKGLTPGIYSGSLPMEFTITKSGIFAPDDPARLQVTDGLRAACAGYYSDDADIRSLLLAIEQDRLNGSDLNTAVATTYSVCFGLDCVSCNLAAAERVYSIETAPPVTETTSQSQPFTLTIGEDGLPVETADSSQISGLVFTSALVSRNTDVGVVTADYNVRIDIIDTFTGEVLASLFGVETDTIRQVSQTEISVVSTIAAGLVEPWGTIYINGTYTTNLSR